MRRSVLLLWSVVTLAVAADQPSITARQDSPAVQSETARLAAVGRLWSTVRYAHPYLTYKDIDWDAALVAALPKIRAAANAREYADAVGGMLAVLNDPATR